MISLVMTTYNGLKYISEQLESIKNQTVLPDEVLIYDDRSTDGTYEYVQEYIEKLLSSEDMIVMLLVEVDMTLTIEFVELKMRFAL